MPIANTLDKMLAAGSNTLMEPVKKNNARLYLSIGNLRNILQAKFPADSAYLAKVGAGLQQGQLNLPLDVSFTPPEVSTEPREILGAGNIRYKYGGWTKFGDATCVFNNFIGVDTFKFFYRWCTVCGGLTLNVNNHALFYDTPNTALPVPGLFDGYLINGIISQYYTADTKAGDETEYSRWVMQNIWPSSVTTSGFDLGGDLGTMVQTNVTFSADICLPVAPN